MGLVLTVISVNQMLSACVMVRPSGCSKTSPGSKSSKTRPRHPGLVAITLPPSQHLRVVPHAARPPNARHHPRPHTTIMRDIVAEREGHAVVRGRGVITNPR